MGISGSSQVGLKTGVCTSTTRPSAPYAGQVVYETDTGLAKVWTGSAWNTLNYKSKVSTSGSSRVDGAFGGNVIYTPATLTVGAGTYEILAYGSAYNVSTTDSHTCAIYNRTTSAEVGGTRGPVTTGSTSSFGFAVSRPVEITVTGSTSFCPFFIRNGASTLRVEGATGAPAAVIEARRIG